MLVSFKDVQNIHIQNIILHESTFHTVLEVFFIGGATLSEDANRDIMLMANGTASSPLGIDVNITDDTTGR